MNFLEIVGVLGLLSWALSGLVILLAIRKAPYMPEDSNEEFDKAFGGRH